MFPLRVLLAPVRAETALLSCSSRNERRLRSCSSWLSAEVRLVMAANCTRCNYTRYRSATRSRAQRSSTHFLFLGMGSRSGTSQEPKACSTRSQSWPQASRRTLLYFSDREFGVGNVIASDSIMNIIFSPSFPWAA
jgi:hypothetical protein